ncbi:MAG: RNA-binding transcriptional accessory protein [Actinomycetia bacterium]|nr:RNA-binding transcriptional accessory protein [Actinomycetes bacterium]
MATQYSKTISEKLDISENRVESTLQLLEDGNTIPFIARYRKEATGNLDETLIQGIEKEAKKLAELDSRKGTILKEIKSQGKLEPSLKKEIESADSLTELEDLYLPFKPKRKTKASVAREKGLEPLAKKIFGQSDFDPESEAKKYLNEKVESTDAALEGAGYIIAEWINEDRAAREQIRDLFSKRAAVRSISAQKDYEDALKYKDYFDYSEPLSTISSHRYLAIIRGEREGYLRVMVSPDAEEGIKRLEEIFVKSSNPASRQVELAVTDSYRRLLSPSMENELRKEAKQVADTEAIAVFANNLRQLLLAPVLGSKRILAIDPGYRTGCKVVCLDEQGDLIYKHTIYPHAPIKKEEEAAKDIKDMVSRFNIEAIAIGNGTAGRETRQFIDSLELSDKVRVFVVSENGASIYSASEVAREEFPDHDVTVRGAVSIGRRLADPLSELVKIDPKSIGVGQYQHDVDQGRLKESLNQVVESCVNMVGVNLNTASRHLLMYVSGLGPRIAENIVNYRSKNGRFKSRKELKQVPKLGDKIFQQCAGFLRIGQGINPLDSSGVHPESYYLVEKIAGDLGVKIEDLIGDKNIEQKIDLARYVDKNAGMLTLKDIAAELAKPGRDPRDTVDDFEFNRDLKTIEDLSTGMVVNGIITNITNFGAFVDIGLKTDGLIHISQISSDFIKHPQDVVSMHQKVKAKVIGIDLQRKRISLSLKDIN